MLAWQSSIPFDLFFCVCLDLALERWQLSSLLLLLLLLCCSFCLLLLLLLFYGGDWGGLLLFNLTGKCFHQKKKKGKNVHKTHDIIMPSTLFYPFVVLLFIAYK